MTLLHQAAQKAVEDLRSIAMRPNSDPLSVVSARAIIAALESTLQQQPEPVAPWTVDDLMQLVFRYGAARCDVDRSNTAKNQRACNEAIDAIRDYIRGAALQHQEEPREPVAWIPYLADRADGVRGHYAISRWNPGTRGYGYRETWNLRSHKWTTCSDEVLTLDQANELLRGLTIPSAPTVMQQEVPSDKQIARAFADEQMRQGSGTHNRHEWFRRGALWAASPSTTRQQEVGSGFWWCAQCQCEVPSRSVTYEETHDVRAGGCGHPVGDIPAAPSTPEKAGGVSDGVGACPGCGRFYPVHLPGCPHVVSASVSHPLPAQANDGGEHG